MQNGLLRLVDHQSVIDKVKTAQNFLSPSNKNQKTHNTLLSNQSYSTHVPHHDAKLKSSM